MLGGGLCTHLPAWHQTFTRLALILCQHFRGHSGPVFCVLLAHACVFPQSQSLSANLSHGSAVSVAAMCLMFPFSLMMKRVQTFASSLITNKARCPNEVCEANAGKQMGCRSLGTDNKSY